MNRFQWNDLDIEARTGEAAHKQEAHSFLVYYDGGAAGEAAPRRTPAPSRSGAEPQAYGASDPPGDE